MDTQTQIDRLIELAIIQRSELKQLVEQLPQLREHLNAEVEKVFDETEPQLRAELEEWTTKQTADKTAALGVELEAKIADLAKSLEVSTQARYNAIIAERAENARLAAEAEAKIAEHAASLPGAVKDIVTAELARFPRAGEIDQLRKEFAEPRGLNPRGKWQAGETYNRLDLVTINGDSYTSNTDGNRTRPSRSSADWTLVAARGTGGGGGPTSLSELTTVPSDGDLLIGSGTSWVTSNLTAGAGISITVGPGAITISATDGDITLDDGTAASPSLHFTNDPDTGIYRPAANTLGISVSGTQVAYFDENGLTVPSAGVVAGGSIHAGNGNANNPSLSFDGDQDTGFFRHQPNEIGIALGGTQYATLTSTTFSITPVVTMASSLRVNGTTDSSNKDTGAIVTEGGLGVEKSASIGGNLTVSGTAITLSNTNSISLNLRGGAPGSSSAGIVLGTNASDIWTIGRGVVSGGNTMEFYASTGTPGTRFSIVDTTGNATLTGNLTVSGGTSTFGTANGGTYITTPGTAASTGSLFIQGGNASGSTAGGGVVLYGGSHASAPGWVRVGLAGTSKFAVNTSGLGAGTDVFTVDQAGNLTVSGTGNSSIAGNLLFPVNKYVYFDGSGAAQTATIGVPTGTNDLYIGNNNALLVLERVSGESYFKVGGTEKLRVGASATTIAGNLTVSGGTITSGSGTLTLNSSANTVVLQSAGTTALTLDSSQRAQFAGTTDSSSSTTGALTVAGGVGIAKKLYVGDNIISTGSNAALFFNSRTGANSNYAWYSPDGTVARLYDNTNAKTLVDFAANTGDATFAGNALISHATGNNSKLSVIKNTAPALNHVAQVVLGQGVGGGFGANDRTYQLVNNGESSTAAYFGIQYWDGSNYNLRLKIDSAGDATFGGKITTSAPTGGAGAWELGVANTVSPTAPNRTITIEIGGTVYYLHAKTTND